MTETLKDLLDKAKERHGVTSGRALADLTNGRKHTIDRTQVNALLKGTYKSELRPSTIRAIAWLAGVDDDRAFRAADQKIPGPPFAEELPPRADYLSDTQRSAVITVIRAFLGSAEEEGGRADGTAAATNGPASGPDDPFPNNVTELSPARSTVQQHGERKRVASRPKRARKPDPGGTSQE